MCASGIVRSTSSSPTLRLLQAPRSRCALACGLRLAPKCAQRQQLEESADDFAIAANAVPRWILRGRADLKWRAPFANIAFLRSQPLALGPFSCLRSWHLELNIFEHRSFRVGCSDPGAPEKPEEPLEARGSGFPSESLCMVWSSQVGGCASGPIGPGRPGACAHSALVLRVGREWQGSTLSLSRPVAEQASSPRLGLGRGRGWMRPRPGGRRRARRGSVGIKA
jgi:hypothetical protein